jgi:hypothetical protein
MQRVSRVCDGNVVQHSDGSVHVMDCPYWSPRASTMLRYDCPGAVISVQSSASSLSGFVVVIRHPSLPTRNGSLIVACAAAVLVFLLIWFGMQRVQAGECDNISLLFNNLIASKVNTSQAE